MTVELPRWIYPTERCIFCDKKVNLSSHHVNVNNPESFVEVHYICSCGYDNAFALQNGYVKSYQEYLDAKKKEESNAPASTIS